jgi:hypothetical protein
LGGRRFLLRFRQFVERIAFFDRGGHGGRGKGAG